MTQCRISVLTVYIEQFSKNVLHLHFIVHLYTAAAAEDDASDADAIITFKAVSENVRTEKVRNCILFLSVEKRINRVYVF